MDGTMKVAVMTGIGKMEFIRREIPRPGAGEVLVKLEYVGVCGSDLHYFEKGRIGDFVVKPPFVLGHEAGGVVVETGPSVTGLKPGDRVALEPGKTCGRCEFCRTGRYNLCPDVVFFATPPVDGVFQEYAVHEAALCFRLPPGMDTMEGALIEPLSVGFHAALTGGARPGQTALVTGSGCIGLVSLLALRVHGVSRVFVTDVVDRRLEKAASLGADRTFNAGKGDPPALIREETGGAGVDLVIETTGTDSAADQGIRALKKGGVQVFVGYSPSGAMTLPMSMALYKELILKTIFRYRHIYPLAIDAVARGAARVRDIVTNIFSFDDIQIAMDQSVRNKAEIVKSVIRLAG